MIDRFFLLSNHVNAKHPVPTVPPLRLPSFSNWERYFLNHLWINRSGGRCGYLVCSMVALYDHAEISYLSSSAGCLPTSLALTHSNSRYLEINLESVPWILTCGTFWDADDAKACRVLASTALVLPNSLIITLEIVQQFLHDRPMLFVSGHQSRLNGRG